MSPLPLPVTGDLLADVELDDDLRTARSMASDIARRVDLPPQPTADLVVAVSELATNALTHGRSPIRLRAWCDGRDLTLEVNDAGGTLTDPLAGFRPPVDGRIGGVGLWIVRQLVDDLEVMSGEDGTNVRLRVAVAARPVPAPSPLAAAAD